MLRFDGKRHAIYVALILLLSLIFLNSIISTSKIMNNVHHANDVTFISQNLKESVFQHGSLHLWTPYYYSGQPLYAQPEYYFLDLNFLYLILFRNIFIAMNLATITYFFLSGLGMYFLFLVFNDNKKGAFIASIIYMFNGYMHSFVIGGNLNVLAGYSLIPFAFMFFVKALQSKDLAKNSIFSGAFIALQLFAGGTLLIPYEIILFGLYSLFYLFGKDVKKRLLKLAIVGIIVILVGFGVSAVKLLPGIEFIDLSNRGEGISYQEYLGEPIQLPNIFHTIVTNIAFSGMSASVGIVGFVLLLFSLYNYRKRYVMFSLVLVVFSILMAVKGPLAELFFKVPIFNQLRHIERAIFLTAFASSLLAGAGFPIFLERLRKLKLKKEMVVFPIVVLLILIELLFLQSFPKSTDIIYPKDIGINSYISQDNGKFRTINLGLSTLVGASGYNYLSQLGIGTIKGGSGIWFNDYLLYLSIAEQSDPAKLWGMLNNKYVISDKELDIERLRFIDKFEECDCPIGEVDGPYLYENLEFMPRAYLVDKAILVIGNDSDSTQLIYSILLNKNFDPEKAVVIKGKNNVGDYSIGELEKYGIIMLSTNLNREDIIKLQSYVDNNGILLPDVFNGKTSTSQQETEALLGQLDSSYQEANILEYENNKAVYDVKDRKGFLVLSERFSNFPGWEATGKSNKETLTANILTTAVYVDGDEAITFKYKPKPFTNGLIISLITLSITIIYFIYSRKKVGGKNKA